MVHSNEFHTSYAIKFTQIYYQKFRDFNYYIRSGRAASVHHLTSNAVGVSVLILDKSDKIWPAGQYQWSKPWLRSETNTSQSAIGETPISVLRSDTVVHDFTYSLGGASLSCMESIT